MKTFKLIDNEFITLPIIRGQDVINKIKFIFDYKGFITGGFPRWCTSPNKNPVMYEDIDIFTLNNTNHNLIKIELLKKNFKLLMECNSYIIFSKNELILQLTKPKINSFFFNFKSINDFLNSCDITVSRVCIYNTTYAIADKRYFFDEKNKIIRIVKKDPEKILHLGRIIKYMNKGYSIIAKDFIHYLQECIKEDELINIKNISCNKTNINFMIDYTNYINNLANE